MDKTSIQEWARCLVEEYPDNLVDPDNYIMHLGQTYDITQEVVKNILTRYPKIPIIVKEVSLASGLHDIGRPLRKIQTFHELRSAIYVERNGLKKGVAGSLIEVYRIAQMLRSHGSVYEFWQDPEYGESRREFEPLDACLLIPRTWQEAIVTYSDLVSYNGERIKADERIREVLCRYSNGKYQNELVVRASRNAQNRLLELAERVEALEQGKLTELDIARYGFL